MQFQLLLIEREDKSWAVESFSLHDGHAQNVSLSMNENRVKACLLADDWSSCTKTVYFMFINFTSWDFQVFEGVPEGLMP